MHRREASKEKRLNIIKQLLQHRYKQLFKGTGLFLRKRIGVDQQRNLLAAYNTYYRRLARMGKAAKYRAAFHAQ